MEIKVVVLLACCTVALGQLPPVSKIKWTVRIYEGLARGGLGDNRRKHPLTTTSIVYSLTTDTDNRYREEDYLERVSVRV